MIHIFETGGRRYAQFESLRRLGGLTHAFSTRPVDVSMRIDDLAEQRAERRRQMVLDFRGDPEQLYCCEQIHEPRVAVIESTKRTGSGEQRLEGFDGATTKTPGVSMMTFSADCPLVLVYDPLRRAVGMAHASWRNTVARITGRLVETMRAEFGCDPTSMLAGVGPSAGPDQYEVRDDVYEAAVNLPGRDRLFRRHQGRMFFDLWEASRTQLVAAGVPSENVEVAGVCTMTRTDLLYSFRREGPGCGHFCLMAMLNA